MHCGTVFSSIGNRVYLVRQWNLSAERWSGLLHKLCRRFLLRHDGTVSCYGMPRRQLLRHQWTLGRHGHVRCREILGSIGGRMHFLCRHHVPSECRTGFVFNMYGWQLLPHDGALSCYGMPLRQVLCNQQSFGHHWHVRGWSILCFGFDGVHFVLCWLFPR